MKHSKTGTSMGLNKRLIFSLLLTTSFIFTTQIHAQELSSEPEVEAAKSSKNPPNILFIVMDDIGIDQMKIFGYGGDSPPRTPNFDTVAKAGVRFRNNWSSPTCSPSRASFFTGRYNIRTNLRTAILGPDLANSAVSPYEHTTPKVLKRKNYVSGVFGKMHLTGSQVNPNTNPFGNAAMKKLGWDHFEGFLDGGPYPIDVTAGGVGGAGGNGKTYGCGFVPSKADNALIGSDQGACYTNQGAACEALSTSTTNTPGRTCLEKGGIFDPDKTCQIQANLPAYINFNTQNAYYTGDWVINDEAGNVSTEPPADARGRGYRSAQEADRAIRWITQQSGDRPWMATIGFSAIHEPVQPVPVSMVPAGSPNTGGFSCTTESDSLENATQMLEAMDFQIGRVLVETGLATYKSDGTLNYNPKKTNTVLVIVGDNGTWTTSVRSPFDPQRAKSTPYQTGVWVPQVIAGPMVKKPGRQVNHMTNNTDLFAFFGEVAGINVRKVLPDTYDLDAKKIMPYLLDPDQKALRSGNFTLTGYNLRSVNAPQHPCYVEAINVCSTLLPNLGTCADQGGIWYGPGGVIAPQSFTSCCQVNELLVSQGKSAAINTISQRAVRDSHYKLVRNELENCSGGDSIIIDEFYKINQARPTPRIDFLPDNLLKTGAPALSKKEKKNYQALVKRLQNIEDSVVPCPGDGNLDKVVDQTDIDQWNVFSATTGTTTENGGGKSSWYDFNLDGLTNAADLQIINDNMGKRCK